MEQVPLRKALELVSGSEPGDYTVEFPSSLCYVAVVQGGLIVSYTENAAIDFLSKSPKTATHRHLWYFAVSFFRPTFGAPRKGVLHISVANLSKNWTTVHVEFKQNGKLCMAGYLTLTDFSRPGGFSARTGWQPSPPPVPTSIESLEADNSPDWVSYVVPFEATKNRKAQTYMKYFLPVKQHSPNILDQWITPCWKDDQLPNGAVWTNDLLHFAIDNVMPLLNSIVGHAGSPSTFHKDIVRAGLAQRRARLEGKQEVLIGKDLSDAELISQVISTIGISMEIKKPLPEEGTKWLFLRSSMKMVLNDRMDYEIIVLDQTGVLVAISHQVLLVISADQKNERKKAAL